ncbi:unnamed protein product [Adineta steineri]|uniref:Uncharacterized protein n=1 Tax=Adineta steineri TaxID=433720 RepID=A0A813MRI4_9BILA|nr:unnamed protein product [Adineta steineri]CAF4089128.1 unnamed protein product [Adineta steineri]
MTDRIPSLFEAIFVRPSTSGCVTQINDYCHVVNAVHELLGSEHNETYSILLESSAFDDTTLNEIFLLGLQQYALFVTDNPQYMPNDFQNIVSDLVRIISLLEEKGTTAVTWYDLKPYVRRFLEVIQPPQHR